jgi:hypothetical protein
MNDDDREPITDTVNLILHRCPECGWITVGGSLHGCVSCLTRREPEPFKVVSAEVYQKVVETIEAHIDTVMPRDGSTVDMMTITNSCVDLWKVIHPEGLRR